MARQALPPELPARAAVPGVPIVEQADFHCGPAALSMVLGWAGTPLGQDEIAARAFTPGARGSYIPDMLGAARREGQLAVELASYPRLLGEVAAGNPVIVYQNLGLRWAPVWHYGVVVGYDRAAGLVRLHSGERRAMEMPEALFLRTWARGDNWAMTMLPPGRLPATARETEVLRAAAALERAGRPDAAAEAYAAGAARWPESWLWPFGLANARYAEGDLEGARAALLAARRLAPGVPEIAANLAEVERALAAGTG